MPPAKSGLFGPCTIWDLDEDTPDGGDFEWFTSKPYPAEEYVSLNTSADVLGVSTTKPPFVYIDTASDVVSGELRVPLVEFETGDVAVEVVADLVNGTLIVDSNEVFYTAPAESAESSADLISGTLEVKLLNYSNWPAESIEAMADVSGGTLG